MRPITNSSPKSLTILFADPRGSPDQMALERKYEYINIRGTFAARNFPHFTPREDAITKEAPITTAKNAASHGLEENSLAFAPPLSIQSETGLDPRSVTKNVGIHNAALKDGRRRNSRLNIQGEKIRHIKIAIGAN